MDHSRLSIIIPTFQRQDIALKLVKQIRKLYEYQYEIIIIDQENKNVLPDLQFNKLKVKYINLINANTSKARNLGIKEAKGDIIIFLDDDVEITKNTISKHLEAYENPDIIGVAGRVINDGENVPVKSQVETGLSNFFATKFVYKFWSTKKQLVDFVYGCNMSFRKKILEKVGGFDEKFPKIFEEVDLSRRVKQFGLIIFEPEALVYHHKAKSGGIRKDEEQKENFIFRNYGYFIAKHVLFPFSLITLFLRTITALKIHPPSVLSLFQGYKEFFHI